MTIDIYYMYASPTCRSVLLAAKALGVQLNLKVVDVVGQQHLKPEYIKINPQSKIPSIVDNGFALYESRAIMAYLVHEYGKNDSLYPKASKARALVDQRLYLDSDLDGRFRVAYIGNIKEQTGIVDNTVKKVDEALKWLDDVLQKSKWSAGDGITIADFGLISTVTTLEISGHDIKPYKNIARWKADCEANMVGYKEIHEAGVANFNDAVKQLHAKLAAAKLG